jgi:hypothetical protein
MLAPFLQRGPELSPSKRGMIIGMRKAGMTFNSIGENVVCLADAARKLWNRYLEKGTVYSAP